jgi:hypothetical protein
VTTEVTVPTEMVAVGEWRRPVPPGVLERELATVDMACALHAFAGCQSPACAPPPVGTGGSLPGGGSGGGSAPGDRGVTWQLVPGLGLIDGYRVIHDGKRTKEAWALKHYGSINVAAAMPDDARAALVEELTGDDAPTLQSWRDELGHGESWVHDVDAEIRRALALGGAFLPDEVKNMPLGVALQLSAAVAYWDNAGDISGRRLAPNFALGEASTQFARDGDWRALSSALTERSGVTVESGFANWVNRSWASSAVSPPALGLQYAIAERDGLTAAVRSMERYRSSGGRTTGSGVLAKLPASYTAYLAGVEAHGGKIITAYEADYGESGKIPFYRGVKTGTFQAGGVLQPNPLSSWSTDKFIATRFAGFEDGGGSVLTVEGYSWEPLTYARWTGLGSESESEVILVGRQMNLIDVEKR